MGQSNVGSILLIINIYIYIDNKILDLVLLRSLLLTVVTSQLRQLIVNYAAKNVQQLLSLGAKLNITHIQTC